MWVLSRRRTIASARPPRRTRQAAGEEHVVLRLEALQLRLENLELTIEVGGFLLGHPTVILDQPMLAGASRCPRATETQRHRESSLGFSEALVPRADAS